MHFDIAIIGGGAAAVSYLDSLSNLLIENEKRASIAIFDEENSIGKGQVYTVDYPWLIMNTPAQDLSAVYRAPNDFIQWASKIGEEIKHGEYVSREFFGNYIKHKFESIKKCDSAAYNINPILSKVKNINKDGDNFIIITEGNDKYRARFVVLASRHKSFNDHYDLDNKDGFIIDPYPLINKISHLSNNGRYLIIGSGLTGVDCAISLFNQKTPSRMVMASRMGYLPEVKGDKLYSCRPKFFLAENILKNGDITLRTLLRYARKEFALHDIDWRVYLFADTLLCNRIEYFKKQVNLAKSQPTTFNIILGMIPELAMIWPSMSSDHVLLFIDKYYKHVQQKHGAIPLRNAEIILSLIFHNVLELKKDIKSIKKNEEYFTAVFHDNSIEIFDYVINTTGPSRKIAHSKENELYVNLLNNGMIEELRLGGLRIKYPEAYPVVKNNVASENFFLIGHNAEGTHIFTNNFQWIVETGFLSAKNLINKL